MLRVAKGDKFRDAKGVEGSLGKGYLPPQPTRGLGSVISSPIGVWGRAPAKIEFGEFLTPKFDFWLDKIE